MAEGLAELGWVVHRATDHYPNDAQEINDEDWLEYGLRNGWAPLCKDGRIKGRRHEREPLITYGGVLFYLNNQRLVRAEMVRRFRVSEPAILRAIERGGPAAYAVGSNGIRRTWP